MKRVVVIGAGVAGLTTSIALADRGFEVGLVEQDGGPLPDSASAAFDEWVRTGAPQLRHSHSFLARLRHLLRAHAPDVLADLLAAGATEIRLADRSPEEMDGFQPEEGDEELVALACRRSTFEWVLRCSAARRSAVSIVTGRVTGLVSLSSGTAIGGVRLASGETHEADLVVDTSGARSALPSWLADAGFGPMQERTSPTGVLYASRFYELRPGADLPSLHLPLSDDLGYLGCGLYPGDNRTFSVTFILPTADPSLRPLLREDAFDRAVAVLPISRPWVDPARACPLGKLHTIARLQNRVRRLVVPGLAAAGDAGVRTNPLYGAGTSLATLGAFGLADVLERDLGPAATAVAFDAFVRDEIEPWHDASAAQDRQRLTKTRVGDFALHGMRRASRTDPAVWRAQLRLTHLLDRPDAMQDPDVLRRVLRAWARRDDRPRVEGPTKAELLSIAAG